MPKPNNGVDLYEVCDPLKWVMPAVLEEESPPQYDEPELNELLESLRKARRRRHGRLREVRRIGKEVSTRLPAM